MRNKLLFDPFVPERESGGICVIATFSTLVKDNFGFIYIENIYIEKTSEILKKNDI